MYFENIGRYIYHASAANLFFIAVKFICTIKKKISQISMLEDHNSAI